MADRLDAEMEMKEGKVNSQAPAPVTGWMDVATSWDWDWEDWEDPV